MPKHRKLRIPHKAIMRAPYLLSLRYPLPDLCSELGVDATTIHVWMRNGLPYERDARKHIHVHGRAVSNWIESVRCKSSPKKPMPAGSGFFISKDGTILTNRHIVEDAALEYVAMTSDGNTYPASVISRSPSQDVAVLKVEGNNFNFIPLGDSKNINVGQTAIALGSDSGEFQNTVSVGVVSGLNKMAAALNSVSGSEDLVALIQIDAATNPGNSGGPLVDLNGRAIGINTVGAPRENIGFALPINLAKKDIADASKLKIKN